jgi:flavin-dependent dehydrogenase
MDDVLIAGAGPAGAVAAIVLARAGARVRLLDRVAFPRDKLCGDTVNPGTLGELRRLGLSQPVEEIGLRIDGMRVTGPGGVTVDGHYPDGLYGRAILRRDLDWALLRSAIAAGAELESGVAVRAPIVVESGATKLVAGVTVGAEGHMGELRARVLIAADGRRATLAFALGLARHPSRPRRCAIGAYYENAHGLSSLGEMHIRHGRYIGVAPVPGGAANVCLVKPADHRDQPLRDSAAFLTAELAGDLWLRERFADARIIRPPVVLGPLAVDESRDHFDGLLVAGDAAGFIDPMTGDGLRFAVRGGTLAAEAALEALEGGWSGVHGRLARRRDEEFGAKWRFNRALRSLVASSAAVSASTFGIRLVPSALSRLVAAAGDCRTAGIECL